MATCVRSFLTPRDREAGGAAVGLMAAASLRWWWWSAVVLSVVVGVSPVVANTEGMRTPLLRVISGLFSARFDE